MSFAYFPELGVVQILPPGVVPADSDLKVCADEGDVAGVARVICALDAVTEAELDELK